jgi:hypothetical protein|tara:strand:- start:31 stop:924 length:894 start_codon:yes stop_codon:yes gene_type:complete
MSFDAANAKIVEWADGQGMFKRAEDPALRVISLGAGVQSTTMALMAVHGEIGPMPDCAVFADTGWEPKAVYDHLDWLMSPNVLPFPVHVVDNGNIRGMLVDTNATRINGIPFFLKNEDDGERGMGRRQCTSEYKVKPIMWKLRELLGKSRRARISKAAVEVWIGISTDEAGRIRPATSQWQQNYWPLVDVGMSRRDCLEWMKGHDYPPPPKSACIGCPFHNDQMWRGMKADDPVSWKDAVAVDQIIRRGDTTQSKATRAAQYMHSSCVPLDEVDLDTAEDRGQLNFFVNECEGMCGV